MSTSRAWLLAAVTLITIAPASALTVPNAVLRLVSGPAISVPVSEEPGKPQWPAQYQVRLLQASVGIVHAQLGCQAVTNYRPNFGVVLCGNSLVYTKCLSIGVMAVSCAIRQQAAVNTAHVSPCRRVHCLLLLLLQSMTAMQLCLHVRICR